MATVDCPWETRVLRTQQRLLPPVLLAQRRAVEAANRRDGYAGLLAALEAASRSAGAARDAVRATAAGARGLGAASAPAQARTAELHRMQQDVEARAAVAGALLRYLQPPDRTLHDAVLRGPGFAGNASLALEALKADLPRICADLAQAKANAESFLQNIYRARESVQGGGGWRKTAREKTEGGDGEKRPGADRPCAGAGGRTEGAEGRSAETAHRHPHGEKGATPAADPAADDPAAADPAAAIAGAAAVSLLETTLPVDTLQRLEVLSQLAFEKLLAAAQTVVPLLDRTAGADVQPALANALKLLAATPRFAEVLRGTLLRHQRQQLFRRFHVLLASTSGPAAEEGAAGGKARSGTRSVPRVIGDLFAFLHQEAVTEADFAAQVLLLPADQPALGEAARPGETGDAAIFQRPSAERSPRLGLPSDEAVLASAAPSPATVGHALELVFDDIFPVLKDRCLAALNKIGTHPVQLFQCHQLFRYFADLLEKVFVAPGAAAVQLCNFFESGALQKFEDAWQKQVFTCEAALKNLPPDSTAVPPTILHHYVGSVVEMLVVLSNSEGTYSERAVATYQYQDRVLSSAITPLLNCCRQHAFTMTEDAAAIFLINTYGFLKESLLQFPIAQSYTNLCETLLNEQVDVLLRVWIQASLSRVDFLPKLEALRNWQDMPESLRKRQPLSSRTALHPFALSACIRSFYDAIVRGQTFLPTQLNCINDGLLRESFRKKLCSAVADAYEEIYKGTQDTETGVMVHSPTQVRLFLNV